MNTRRPYPVWVHVLLFAILLSGSLSACDGGDADEQRGVVAITVGGQLPDLDSPDVAPDPVDEAEAVGIQTVTEPSAEQPTTPPPEEAASVVQYEPVLLPEAAVVMMSPTGGELTTGGFTAVIPGVDFEEATEVSLTPISAGDIRDPRPLSVALAAAELRPLYAQSGSMMDLTFPLSPAVETGMVLQLLSFNRSMNSFSVVDERRATLSDSITFRTDVFSQYVVIARPILSETACMGERFAIDEREPNVDENVAVGWVELENRMSREVAFAVLTDMRYLPGAERIIFKNEEVNAPGQPHVDEDFLVDPRLADPLVALGQSVLDRWSDPIGGGPAFRLRVTDSYDSLIEHSPRSNHYRGLAVDLTLSPVPAANRSTRRDVYGWLARLTVCAGFDFVDFENRFHIHASSRPARLAYIAEGPRGRSIVVSQVDGSEQTIISEQVDLALDEYDVRTLDFSRDGRTLSLVGRRKGAPEAFQVNLDTMEVQVVEPPDEIPWRRTSLDIDPSLNVGSWEGRLVVRRPLGREIDLADAAGAGPELAGVEPFAITAEGVGGTVPAIWTEPLLRDDTNLVGEASP